MLSATAPKVFTARSLFNKLPVGKGISMNLAHSLKRGFLLISLLALFGNISRAQSDGFGFQLNRYEPTAAGEWSFLVDHPWYSSSFMDKRYFSAGITLDYGHNPLVPFFIRSDGSLIHGNPVIEHQLLGHVNLAGSFLDRVLLTLSLPVTFWESGNGGYGITPSGVAVGDLRFGFMVRIFGQPYQSAVSLSLGGYLWFPINSYTNTFAPQEAESGWRAGPKLTLGGLAHHVQWSFSSAFYYRPEATLGISMPMLGDNTVPATVGSEFQAGVAIRYADLEKRFSVGPEALYSLGVLGSQSLSSQAMSLEVLLGAHYNIAHYVNVGLGVGIGTLRQPGSPDARALLKIEYAPMTNKPRDTDGDGLIDPEDRCPTIPGPIENQGCPWPDTDGDGLIDPQDKCPTVPGPKENQGCPWPDTDGDGVLDKDDKCVTVPGPKENRGCPWPEEIKVKDKKLFVPHLSLKETLFETDKYDIKPESEYIVQGLADILIKRQPNLRLSIEGHADRRGSRKYNLELSLNRANSIKNWLVAHGVKEERLQTKGFGFDKPIDPARTLEAYEKNRRVEFIILNEIQPEEVPIDGKVAPDSKENKTQPEPTHSDSQPEPAGTE